MTAACIVRSTASRWNLSEVIRLLTYQSQENRSLHLRGFYLEVVDQVPILPPISEHIAQYHATKRDQ